MTLMSLPKRLLVAIGGNATHPEDIEGTSIEQKTIAERTANALLPLALLDNELVITHGNGPVVGKILMRQALTRDRIAPMPLDICVAHSQGGIAYLLMQAIENALRRADSERHVACLLTQVDVDADDAAFADPSKPVGPFFTEEEAKTLAGEFGWLMKEDAGRGWRYVVPSPQPRTRPATGAPQPRARPGPRRRGGGPRGSVRAHRGREPSSPGRGRSTTCGSLDLERADPAGCSPVGRRPRSGEGLDWSQMA